MPAYAFDNAAQAVTSTTVASGATTVALSASALFDASGKQYIVRADDSATTAYMYALVTGNNTATNVLTWTEGVDGTSAIGLGNASTITEVLTKQVINGAFVRLDTGVSQTLTGPLVVPVTAGGSTVSTSYGSMPLKIATTTLGTTATGVTFSSIPGGFTHLFVEYQARGDQATTAQECGIQFNGDATTGHYTWLRLTATGGSVVATDSGTAAGSIAHIYVTGADAPAGVAGAGRIEIPNYATTSFIKSLRAHVIDYNSASFPAVNATVVDEVSGYWGNTATITSILLFPSAGNFIAGTVVSMFGVP